MLTIFTIPKPFSGHIKIIQRNAIQSWSKLHPECEIILCGNETGVEEAAAEFKAKLIPDLARNGFGTPLLNSAFDQVEEVASHRVICFVNTDIMLLNDFLRAVQRVRLQKFLLVGQRWDIDLRESWDFERSDWEVRLKSYISTQGQLHPPSGSDYFVYPRGLWLEVPPFAVGRTAWDNWLIFKARHMGVPVIDGTGVITVIHQNHDYSHVNITRLSTKGPETERNLQLAGGENCLFTLNDATCFLSKESLRLALTRVHVKRRLEAVRVLKPGSLQAMLAQATLSAWRAALRMRSRLRRGSTHKLTI